MNDIRDLYQEVIIDHSKNPRNFYKIESTCYRAEGINPLCGDRLALYLELDEGKITNASFVGTGCAISTASASLMTEYLKGRTREEAEILFQEFHQMLTQSESSCPSENLGKLKVLSGVREYPSRVKCATLAWHTLRSALDSKNEPVSTE